MLLNGCARAVARTGAKTRFPTVITTVISQERRAPGIVESGGIATRTPHCPAPTGLLWISLASPATHKISANSHPSPDAHKSFRLLLDRTRLAFRFGSVPLLPTCSLSCSQAFPRARTWLQITGTPRTQAIRACPGVWEGAVPPHPPLPSKAKAVHFRRERSGLNGDRNPRPLGLLRVSVPSPG